MQDNADTEMFSLRRSARIAEKQRIQFMNNITAVVKKETTSQTSPKPKIPRKKCRDNAKMNIDVQIKKKTRRSKKTKKINKKIIEKFANLATTKLNDIFPLIQKYALTEDEKHQKYIILQTIIKGCKTLNIDNFLTEIYINKHKIIIYVHKKLLISEYSFTLEVISNHMNDILSYREIDDLDTVVMQKKNECIQEDKQIAEHQMKNDLQEIDNLNAMICRLMM